MAKTTGAPPHKQGTGQDRTHKAVAARIHRDNENTNRRPDDRHGDPLNEVDRRYLDDRDRRGQEDPVHYDGSRVESDRYDLNARQNGWQANIRVDSINDDGRNRQWRETVNRESDRDQISGGHPNDQWRPNSDWRNEQRNGSEYDRDRSSYGNSRFRDDDHGYRTSRHDNRDYGHDDEHNDPRQPRGYTATSERDYDDRNPSREQHRPRRDD